MTKTDDIVEAIREKFEINPREWQHLCFEGEYVPEMIREAVRLTVKEIKTEMLKNNVICVGMTKDFVEGSDWCNLQWKHKMIKIFE